MYVTATAMQCPSFALLINSWVTIMNPDPIILEIWRIREEYSRQFDGDLRAMMDDLRRRHAESGRKSATCQPKLRRRAPVDASATD